MKLPRIHLKIINKKGEVVSYLRSGKKRRILAREQRDNCKDCYIWLKVIYCDKPLYTNEGRYTTKTSFKQALNAFLEKDLLKEFCLEGVL